MKKTKKAVSLILAFAMVLSAMLGCMTVSSFATEGQAGEGPKLVDYSIGIANTDPKTEYGSQITVDLKFDKTMGSTSYTKSAFDIYINDRSLKDMGFEVTGVTPKGQSLEIVLQGINSGDDSWAYVVSGKFDISLKSNYYEDIVDSDGNEVSDWTDIHTYVQTGLEFERTASVKGNAETPASVTFKLTGDAKLRGASPVQILVAEKSIVCTEVIEGAGEDGGDLTLGGNCNESRGTVNVHTHMYLIEDNTMWAKQLAGNFHSKDYTMTADGDTVTITANKNGENTDLAENTVMRAFGYSEGDAVVQPVLFREELEAAKARAEEIKDSNRVAQACKDALNEAIEQADQVNADEMGNGVEWLKARAALQSAVDGAQDNGIATTSVTRSDGTVSLSLTGAGRQWIDEITEIKITANDSFGKILTSEDYEISGGKLIINSTAFDKDGEVTPRTRTYTITIKSTDFADVTGEVAVTYKGANKFTIRYIDKNGEVKASYSLTKAEMEALGADIHEETYNTACSMTGLRTFKAKGVYIEDLIEKLGLEEKGITLNPDILTVKLRTNDSLKGDENDSDKENGYYSRSQTTYNNLMQERYSFPNLYNEESDLGETALSEGYVSDALREALGADERKVSVKPMIAYEYVETVYNSNQSSPADMKYDPNLSADKAFRFLFGTAMTEENGKTVASKETTTWMASYQVYGLDIVDESVKIDFDTTPSDADIVLKDSTGKVMTADSDGSYTVASSSSYPYTYTVSADGYKTKTESTAFTENQTVTVSLSRESSGGGGSSTVEDPEKEYTVTFDTNGGSSVTKQTVVSGDKAVKPADPTKDGYEFAGWYADSGLTKAYDFSSKVTGSITLYAKWTEAEDDQPVQKVTFSDVPSDAWYAEYVSYLAGKGIVNGKTENTFAPDAQITRAEFVKIIAGVAGADISGSAASGFSDVASDAWYAPYVAWGVKNGIINGTSATTFNPNGNITREDMATIIKRYTDFAKFTLPTDTAAADFSDSAQISSYAADAVKAMQQANIINGKGDNTFAPKDNATRAEACKMLTVLMKMMEA